jgi:hypothetical protein
MGVPQGEAAATQGVGGRLPVRVKVEKGIAPGQDKVGEGHFVKEEEEEGEEGKERRET